MGKLLLRKSKFLHCLSKNFPFSCKDWIIIILVYFHMINESQSQLSPPLNVSPDSDELAFEYNSGDNHYYTNKGLDHFNGSENGIQGKNRPLYQFNFTMERYKMMSSYGYIISAMLLFIIWVVGSIGNFLVIYLVARNRQLQTPMNLLLINLSAADFIMAALGSPISFTAAALGIWPFGSTGCIIYAFGMALGGITSITTLMVLAFERFLMIARPFRAADIQKQHSVGLIISIWVYSLTLTLPPILGWASYGPEAAYISCSVSWEVDDLGTTTYIVFLFAMGLVAPTMTIILSYCGILFTIRQAGGQSAASGTRKAELRVVGMVAVMVFSFLAAWTPYAIVSLIVAFSSTYRSHITGFVAVLPSIFAKSSSCFNPIIYVGLNTQFRTAWLKLLGIQVTRDEEGATAISTAAHVCNKESSLQDENNSNSGQPQFEGEAESSFICKTNRKQPDFNKSHEEIPATTPLLQIPLKEHVSSVISD